MRLVLAQTPMRRASVLCRVERQTSIADVVGDALLNFTLLQCPDTKAIKQRFQSNVAA